VFDLGITQVMAAEERKKHTGEYWWLPVTALAKGFLKD
jgi:hypothetical protein